MFRASKRASARRAPGFSRSFITRTTAVIITLRQMNVSVSCATVIRFFVYGVPTLLVALIAAAFVNVSLLSANKKNEMSIGTLGEPSTLNPIQQADAAAGEVQAVIFNGLLKYDQNLEITTDLAKSFSLSQTTTLFFPDPNAALTALLSLETQHSQWKDWKLNAVRIEENRLVLELAEPGMENSQKIVSALKPLTIVPLHVIRVDLQDKAKETLEAFTATPEGSQIVRHWIESSSA